MLYRRQKLLLRIIKILSERNIHSKTYLMKAIFLLRQKFGFEKIGYDFFPYKYGPFSNEIYADISALERAGLFDEATFNLTENGVTLVKELETNEEIFSELENIFRSYSDREEIKKVVYDNFPEFTINSNSPRLIKTNSSKGICSIGYEGKTIDCFLNKLIQNRVSVLVDVRKNAISMKKGFSKKRLANHLSKANIEYLHFPELGIESEKRKNLKSAEDYKELFKEYKESLPAKSDKIKEVEALGKKQKVALMCFEADHNCCHRGILSNNLAVEVVHL